jgi:hypothetical protein
MYGLFKTEPMLETEGVVIDYGSFRVTIARAGGMNKRFAKTLEAKTKPVRRAIQTETLDAERGLDILREVYAEAVILRWETKKADTFVIGIESPDGDILPFTKENVIQTFRNLPDLFTDIQDQAGKTAIFRQDEKEKAAGNLLES